MTDNLHADVATDRPDRYAKQLVSHLGRRNGGEWSAETRSGWIDLNDGKVTVTTDEGVLHVRVDGDAESLDHLADVVERHLVRFGQQDEFAVHWQRGTE